MANARMSVVQKIQIVIRSNKRIMAVVQSRFISVLKSQTERYALM